MSFALRLLLLLGLAGSLRAVTLEETNADFATGNYARAAAACEQLIASEGHTAARLYNLGNARYRLKEYGPAILAWERAALLSPRDPDIRANLQLARKDAAFPNDAPALSWWARPLRWCSLHEWSWITTAGAVFIALAALTWGIAGLARPGMKRSVTAGLAIGTLATALGGFALWNRQGETALGIITAAKPVLRLSPFTAAESVATPASGRTVILGERARGWVHVTTRDAALSGWLAEDEVAPLMPKGNDRDTFIDPSRNP